MKNLALQSFDDQVEAYNSACFDPPDYCSREGAVALKEKIEAYWRSRGQDVMIALHNVGFHPAIRAARYDVRSDMVNGLPRVRRASAQKPSIVPSSEEVFIEDFDDGDIDFQ